MKTISNIILEESIRLALIEQMQLKPKPKPEDGNTPKPEDTDNKLDTKQAFKIAQTIYNTKGSGTFSDDDEDALVTAFKSIPNMTTFWQVNKILKANINQSLNKYISTYIDSNELDVWVPILQHLIKINASSEVLKVYKSRVDWDEVKEKYPKLAKKITDIDAADGVTVEKQDFTSNPYFYIFLSAGAAILAYKLGLHKAGWKYLKNSFKSREVLAKSQPYYAGTYSIENLTGLARPNFSYLLREESFWNMSKDKIIQLLKNERQKKRLSKEEYQEAYVVLSKLNRSDINKVKFNLVIDAMKRRDVNALQAGNVQKIIKMIDDPEFTKTLGPKLQAIEDDLLGIEKKQKVKKEKEKKEKEKNNTDVSVDDVIDDISKIKQAGFSTKTPNFKSWNMDRWLKLQSLMGKGIGVYDTSLLKKIGNEFIKIWPMTPGGVPEVSRKAILNILNTDGKQSLDSLFKQHPGVKRWYDWMLKTKSGNRSYIYYDNLNKFPPYERWAISMKRMGIKNYTEQDYDVAYYNWLNARTL
jgi:hypothetical protein